MAQNPNNQEANSSNPLGISLNIDDVVNTTRDICKNISDNTQKYSKALTSLIFLVFF